MANNISLYQEKNQIIIEIEDIKEEEKSTATIISNSGETVKRFDLRQGKNTINTSRYYTKNCSVRIQNGNNVLVQKIGT